MAYWIILYISMFSPLLPLVIGFRKRKNLLWLYALAGFSFDSIFLIIRKYYSYKQLPPPNLSLAENIFLLLEFILISLYYRNKVFQKNKFFIPAITILILLYVFSSLAKYNLVLNLVSGTIFDLSCIIYSIIGFYFLLKKKQVIFLDKSPFFWVNIALLIYCTGNFLVFLFASYLQERDRLFLVNLWVFHNVLNILFSILIAISFLKRNNEE